ncbi:MAG: hypothetical protein GEU28_02170 [Dehalococcoidia bacterium]|nr:hypothetical protein [Dehalococcoidia bacterium]
MIGKTRIRSEEAEAAHPRVEWSSPERGRNGAVPRERSIQASSRIGDQLVEAGLISEDQLDQALRLQIASGVRLGQALLSLGYLEPGELAMHLARQHGLPFFDLSGAGINPAAVTRLSEDLCHRHSLVPIASSESGVTLAVADPTDDEAIQAARQALGEKVRLVVSTSDQVEEVLAGVHHERHQDMSTYEFVRRNLPESAYRMVSVHQRALLFLFATCATVLGLFLHWTLIEAVALLLVATLVVYAGARLVGLVRPTPGRQAPSHDPDDRDLPVLTILATVDDAAADIDRTVRRLAAVRYPPAKLDVRILLSAAVPCERQLPFNMQLIRIPVGDERHLGIVLNHGLLQARGEIVSVLNKASLPHPDEARLAASALSGHGRHWGVAVTPPPRPGVRPGVFTRLAAIGRRAQWELARGVGATAFAAGSVFVRTELLRRLGGWDPFTHDSQSEFALRLRKAGLKVAVLPTVPTSDRRVIRSELAARNGRYAEAWLRLFLIHTRAADGNALLVSYLTMGPWLQLLAWLFLPLVFAGHVLGATAGWVSQLVIAGLALDIAINLAAAVVVMVKGRLWPGLLAPFGALFYLIASLQGHLLAVSRILTGGPSRPWPQAHPRSQPVPLAAGVDDEPPAPAIVPIEKQALTEGSL